METDTTRKPWEDLRQAMASSDAEGLRQLIGDLTPDETARAVSRLSAEEQAHMLVSLEPPDAAEVIREVSQTQAAGLIHELPPDHAAAIIDEIPSDRQADLLGELKQAEAEAIVQEMPPEHAETVRKLLAYPPDVAGGIMVSEYVSCREDRNVGDVIGDLQANRDAYAKYEVQYVYVTDGMGRLIGVLRMRDLLFSTHKALVADAMIESPLRVPADAQLQELKAFFDQHRLFGVPVVDGGDCLVGVVRRASVEAAVSKQATRQLLGISGIMGGEEFRSMPLMLRSGRRLSWLTINIVLNIVAASVIAVYQDTLQAAIALAIFLPMISDMSGCSGNQAVAVSMRELTLGLIRPGEILRVLAKEASLGLLNGLALGVLLGCVAMLWKGNPYLGFVVGGALAANTVVAVSIGGVIPLLLKAARLDPALVSGPLLTTVTDMCGFFFALSFATAVLPRLATP